MRYHTFYEAQDKGKISASYTPEAKIGLVYSLLDTISDYDVAKRIKYNIESYFEDRPLTLSKERHPYQSLNLKQGERNLLYILGRMNQEGWGVKRNFYKTYYYTTIDRYPQVDFPGADKPSAI